MMICVEAYGAVEQCFILIFICRGRNFCGMQLQSGFAFEVGFCLFIRGLILDAPSSC